ncbi:hypothetical protein M436DRAFT_40028 [Aureobasidium namibiae CBS 147.97]|uniref:RNase MRP protein 1 RNA binding domain-containing protein n=1 Tax=Aureobasidium namibiae CBS 147.97 TaxID=1043004 RepID=A0A074WW48_9PEZI|nr:uncharacterized protein M436DRAFT_40028 [Aureobasidium namibiae CBS 147.97]KEQ75739.1 hypothetical protein M436DRAFT_40028 [Aureobasidium namibiae CBS 147.97]
MERTTITTILNLAPLKLPSTSQTADLQHLHALMHLLHHRNHNQHRRTTWYRHFNSFRRHLGTVLEHLTTLEHVPTTNLARHKKKAEDEASRLRVQQTVSFWRDVLIPKAQHAFGQLIADGRFAVLGVVLMAILGHVCRVFGLISVYDELGEEETRRAIEEFAAEEWGDAEGMGVLVPREAEKNEDFGEVLTREDSVDTEDAIKTKARATEKELRMTESASPSKTSKKTPSRDSSTSTTSSKLMKKRPKDEGTGSAVRPIKKKKKKNAIDDLFAGL